MPEDALMLYDAEGFLGEHIPSTIPLSKFGLEEKPTVEHPIQPKSQKYLSNMMKRYYDQESGRFEKGRFVRDEWAKANKGYNPEKKAQEWKDSLPLLFAKTFKATISFENRYDMNILQSDHWTKVQLADAKIQQAKLDADRENRLKQFQMQVDDFEFQIKQFEKTMMARAAVKAAEKKKARKLRFWTSKTGNLVQAIAGSELAEGYDTNKDYTRGKAKKGKEVPVIDKRTGKVLRVITLSPGQTIPDLAKTETTEELPYTVGKKYTEKVGDEWITSLYKGQDEKGKNVWEEKSRADRHKPGVTITIGERISETETAKDKARLRGPKAIPDAREQAKKALPEPGMWAGMDDKERNAATRKELDANVRAAWKTKFGGFGRDPETGRIGWFDTDGKMILEWSE